MEQRGPMITNASQSNVLEPEAQLNGAIETPQVTFIDAGKQNVLGVRVDAVNYEGAVQKIITAAREGKKLSVSALAVHGVMTGVLDETHRYRLNRLDLVCPDGQPVRWAINLLYKKGLPDRVCGPELMLRICERAAQEKLPIYLYGSRPETLEILIKNLCDRFPDLIIAGYQPSRFRQVSAEEKQQIIEEIRNSGAAMTFVGLGCPRQEVWVYEYCQDLPMPVMAVGAAYDFHAGRISQAPKFMQRWGLEWFYRLMQEPNRLWRRYVFLNPLYISLFILQFFKIVYFDPAKAIAPTDEMRYG